MSDKPTHADAARLFEEVFEDLFPREGQRGADLRIPCEITLAQAVEGCKRSLSFRREVRCGACDGSGCVRGTGRRPCPTCEGGKIVTETQGLMQTSRMCADCRGVGTKPEQPCPSCLRGFSSRDESLTVSIPPGTRAGDVLRLAGKGNELPGAPPGDAHLAIEIALPEGLAVDGDNLHTRLTIGRDELKAGGRFTVPGLHGAMPVEVPAGARDGDVLTILGSGLIPRSQQQSGAHYRDAAVRGDLLVTLRERPSAEPPYLVAGVLVVVLGLLLSFVVSR